MVISDPSICPVRGFTKLGPIAYPRSEETQRITLYRISAGSHVAVSGIIFITTAFLKPAFSNASFHLLPALRTVCLNSTGVVFSTHQTMGSTGSLKAAFGSFLTRCHLLITSRSEEHTSEL